MKRERGEQKVRYEGIDFMVDIETLGVVPNAMILTLGAVAFNPYTGEIIGNPFYGKINTDSYRAYTPGFTFDHATLAWWMTQPDDARLEAFTGERQELSEVLQNFVGWCKDVSKGKKIRVWSHGASFDVPIISYALAMIGIEIPWKFWDIRDTRTLFDTANLEYRNVPMIALNGKIYPSHHPLGDCARQIEGVKLAYKKLE